MEEVEHISSAFSMACRENPVHWRIEYSAAGDFFRKMIRAAIINTREQWPQRRITVGLSPASLPKRGSGFDLGIAVSILAAAGVVPLAAIEGVAFLGELGLDGQVRAVRGVLPAVAAAAPVAPTADGQGDVVKH